MLILHVVCFVLSKTSAASPPVCADFCEHLNTLDRHVAHLTMDDANECPLPVWFLNEGVVVGWNDASLAFDHKSLQERFIFHDDKYWLHRALNHHDYLIPFEPLSDQTLDSILWMANLWDEMGLAAPACLGVARKHPHADLCERWTGYSIISSEDHHWYSAISIWLVLVLLAALLVTAAEKLGRRWGWWKVTLGLFACFFILGWSAMRFPPLLDMAALTSASTAASVLSDIVRATLSLGLSIYLLRNAAIFRATALPDWMPSWFFALVAYIIILIGINGTVLSALDLGPLVNVIESVSPLSVLPFAGFLTIAALLMKIAALFFVSHIIITKIIAAMPSINRRTLILFTAAVANIPLISYLAPSIPIWGYLTLSIAVLVLMDLYVESKYRSISWVVVWLVCITTSIASILYSQATPSPAPTPAGKVAASSVRVDSSMQAGTSVTADTLAKYPLFSKDDTRSLRPKSDPAIRFIVLFTYIFTSLTVLLGLLLLLHQFYRFIPREWHGSWPKRGSIRQRIQYAMLALLALCFALIYFLTILYVRADASARVKAQDDLARASLEHWAARLTSFYLNDPSTVQAFIELNPELILFDSAGYAVSSEERFYRVPQALLLEEPTEMSSASKIETSWHWAYIRKFELDTDMGFLAYVLPKSTQHPNIIDRLKTTLLHIYLFLFVISASLALAFADSITRPLFKLSHRLGRIQLLTKNEKIEWTGNDELAQLVKAYNGMIHKIEESIEALAMTERETAWREMAKQVAHEIKNPLTPMKLSLQHMQMAVQRNPEQADELIQRNAKTLLIQIDHLAAIASEFSNFAQMPQPSSQKVVLNEIVSSVHDLFRKRDDIDIQLRVPVDEMYVFADQHHLMRVLINLLTNAIQAIPTDREGHIYIRMFKEHNNAVVSITDNGTGIERAIWDKIFKPNFTSKRSGTGLGLAICAKIIELFNGRIYFDTELGKGSTFFVELPLLRLDDNFPEVTELNL